MTNECGPVMLPYRILDNHVIKRNEKTSLEVLVQWDSLCDDDNTWEEIEVFKKAYVKGKEKGASVRVYVEHMCKKGKC